MQGHPAGCWERVTLGLGVASSSPTPGAEPTEESRTRPELFCACHVPHMYTYV